MFIWSVNSSVTCGLLRDLGLQRTYTTYSPDALTLSKQICTCEARVLLKHLFFYCACVFEARAPVKHVLLWSTCHLKHVCQLRKHTLFWSRCSFQALDFVARMCGCWKHTLFWYVWSIETCVLWSTWASEARTYSKNIIVWKTRYFEAAVLLQLSSSKL